MTLVASSGDKLPSAQAATTEDDAAAASAKLLIGPSSNVTARSRRRGISRSRQSRSAVESPPLAFSSSLRIIASNSPSRRSSAASVALLRDPFGRPAGLPLCPASKGRPRCIPAVLSAALVCLGWCPLYLPSFLAASLPFWISFRLMLLFSLLEIDLDRPGRRSQPSRIGSLVTTRKRPEDLSSPDFSGCPLHRGEWGAGRSIKKRTADKVV